jgi:hypothetical protein
MVRLVVALGDMALDVFDDNDGVVDDEAGGEGDAEQRERVDGETEDTDEGEGSDERNRNRDSGDEGRAPILQEEEDDKDDDDDGFDEGLDDFADGCADDGGGVEGDGVFHARREGTSEAVHLGFGIAIDLQGIGVAQLLHAEADGGNAVEGQSAAIGFGAQFGMADVFDLDDAGGGVLDHDVVELLGSGETPDDVHGNLEGLFLIGGRRAKLAGGNFDVLLGESIDDVGGGELAGGELDRVEPDAHGIFADAEDGDVADAFHALESILDVDVEVVAHEEIAVLAVLGVHAGAEDEIGGGLADGDAGLIDLRGQQAGGGTDAVLHVDGGDVEVVAGIKGGGDDAGAVVPAGGLDIAHARDTVDGFFERDGDSGFDLAGIGSDIAGGDEDLRRRELRVERNREGRNDDGSGEDDKERANGGENRAVNEEINQGWPRSSFLILI